MAAKSIKEILDGFVALSKDALVKKGWWPNKIYYKGKEALIVVTKSPNGDDFAINKKSLYDHSAAIAHWKVGACSSLLARLGTGTSFASAR
jgi:hypothetical protein